MFNEVNIPQNAKGVLAAIITAVPALDESQARDQWRNTIHVRQLLRLVRSRLEPCKRRRCYPACREIAQNERDKERETRKLNGG